MLLISRFFDLLTTVFFVFWMLLYMAENHNLASICLATALISTCCMLAFRLFVFYKITPHRLKQ